jgi:hypothetical protein
VALNPDGDQQQEGVNSMDLVIERYKQDLDLTLTEEMLKLTPDERIRRLEEFDEFREELQSAMRKKRDQVR